MRIKSFCFCLRSLHSVCPAQKRLVLIDQDGSGPGGSNQMAMLALLQAPQVEVLGITMVTGNAWRDEETLHTLRMLELTGHANVPVAKGAVFPLVRTQEETQLAAAIDGKVAWLGAWGQGPDHAGGDSERCQARHSGAPRARTARTRFRPCRKGSPPSSPSTKTRRTSSFARCARIRTR